MILLQKYQQLKKNASVIIDGPYGTFTEMVANKKKILFIAGGIGITPIRSLLEQMAKLKKDIILLYANKKKEGIVFKKEIEKLEKEYNFFIYHILSQETGVKKLFRGRIDKEKIQLIVPDIIDREVYLCGPVTMINQLRKDLIYLGVSNSAIHFEKFSL